MLLWIDFDPLLKQVTKRGFGVDDKLSGVRLQRAKHPGRLVETKPYGYYSILFWLFKWQILKNGVKVKISYNGTFLPLHVRFSPHRLKNGHAKGGISPKL